MLQKLRKVYAPAVVMLLAVGYAKPSLAQRPKKKIRITETTTIDTVSTNTVITQPNTVPASLKGLYVNRFSSMLGITEKEDSLLMYAKGNNYNYLALYSLQAIDFSSTTKKNQLAAFIKKARTHYGIVRVGAIGETFTIFRDRIGPYNTSRTDAAERFDIFNLEFEFWIPSSVQPGGVYAEQYLIPQGYSPDTAGGFKFYQKHLTSIDSLAKVQGVLSETYVGWLNQGQAQFIANKTNRILVHAYRTDANSTFAYTKTRLSHFASGGNKVVNIAPIFSSEPEFMGPWLAAGNNETAAFNTYKTNYDADLSTWKQYIKIDGYQWFKHSLMPKVNLSPKLASEDVAEVLDLTKPTLSIYPNPAKGRINIDLGETAYNKLDLRVVSINGQLVHNEQVLSDKGSKFRLDLSKLAAGLYIVQLKDDEGNISLTEKIILQ